MATIATAMISVAASDLADALDACRPLLVRTPTIPGSPAVSLRGEEGRLSVSAADHGSAIRLAIPCHGDWPEPVVVPAEPLSQLVARLHGDVTLEASAKGVRIAAGGFAATLPRLSPDGILAVDRDLAERDVTTVRIPVADAIRLVGAARAAVPRTDMGRPYLEGVLLETKGEALQAVGSDGHRLVGAVSDRAVIESATAPLPPRTAILPRAAVATIMAATAGVDSTREDEWLTLRLGAQGYRIEGASWRLVGLYLPGPYPDWRRVVDPLATAKASCTLDRAGLRAALRRAAILADQHDRHAVSLALLPDEVSVQVRQSEGESTEAIPAQVEPACVGINVTLDVTLLLPLLDAFTGDQVALTLPGLDRINPVLLTAPGETTVALVMPLQR